MCMGAVPLLAVVLPKPVVLPKAVRAVSPMGGGTVLRLD